MLVADDALEPFGQLRLEDVGRWCSVLRQIEAAVLEHDRQLALGAGKRKPQSRLSRHHWSVGQRSHDFRKAFFVAWGKRILVFVRRLPVRYDFKRARAFAPDRLKHREVVAFGETKVCCNALTLRLLRQKPGEKRTQLASAIRIGSKRKRM